MSCKYLPINIYYKYSKIINKKGIGQMITKQMEQAVENKLGKVAITLDEDDTIYAVSLETSNNSVWEIEFDGEQIKNIKQIREA